jgi:tetratricopeptide (TPR) repeat protein
LTVLVKIQVFSFLMTFLFASSCVNYDRLIEEGKKESESGNQVEAIIKFNKALLKDDKRIEAYYGLGFSYGENCKKIDTNCQQSIDFFTQVIEMDSSYRHAFYNRANNYIQIKDFEAALKDLTNKYTINKIDADYYGNRSICYLETGDTVLSHANYVYAVKLNQSKQSYYLENIFDRYFSRKW